MKIAILADSPSTSTGFGCQSKLLCEAFANEGAEVFLLASSVPMEPILMKGVTEWRFQGIQDIDVIDRQIHLISPDVVIVFGHTAYLAHFLSMQAAPRNCPVLYWLPYEGSILSDSCIKMFKGTPDDVIVHMSKFAEKLWQPLFRSNMMIHHGVDCDVWKPLDDSITKKELRRKWSERLKFPFFEDALIVINIDRNIWHKRWDATYDVIRRLKNKSSRPVQLIAHTLIVQKGINGHPPGFNLPYMERQYGLDNKICYTGFDWDSGYTTEDLVELSHIADVRISTSQGEGFGIPVIEFGAAEIPQVVNNHTTMPEIFGVDSLSLVDPAMTEEKQGSLWQVPNTEAMSDRILKVVEDVDAQAGLVAEMKERVTSMFSSEVVSRQWVDLTKLKISERSQEEIHYSKRWAFLSKERIASNLNSLAVACHLLKAEASVLELNAWNGDFVACAIEQGLDITGIEEDTRPLKYCSLRARPYIQIQQVHEKWPFADILVALDAQDVWFELGDLPLVELYLEKISFYEWALLSFRPKYKWNQPSVSPAACRSILQSKNMVRRCDIERLVIEKLPNFDFEIWRRNGDINYIPPSLRHTKPVVKQGESNDDISIRSN